MSIQVERFNRRLMPLIRRGASVPQRISARVKSRRPSADQSRRSQPPQSPSVTSWRIPPATSARSMMTSPSPRAVSCAPPSAGAMHTTVRSGNSAPCPASRATCSSASCQQPIQGSQRASRSPAAAGVVCRAPPRSCAAAGSVRAATTRMTYKICCMLRIVLSSTSLARITMRQNTNRTPAEILSPVRSRSNPASAPSRSAAAHA